MVPAYVRTGTTSVSKALLLLRVVYLHEVDLRLRPSQGQPQGHLTEALISRQLLDKNQTHSDSPP